MEMKNINDLKEMKAWIDMKFIKEMKKKKERNKRIERIVSLDGNQNQK